ncbi:MAG: ester cyclase [Bacteroidetes bacterium]|nr:ester cyclase [Bacteroidota bacterium]
MSIENHKAAVTAFVHAISEQEWATLDALVAENVVRRSRTYGQPELRGRAQLVQFLKNEALTFPDARQTILYLVAEGDRVAAALQFTGTQRGPMGPFPASGRRVHANFLAMFRLEDGRIAEVWVEWDNLSALLQLGHLTLPS